MKPTGFKGSKGSLPRKSLEHIKEEVSPDRDIEDQDPNPRPGRHSSSAKKPKMMKGGVRQNPARELLTQAQRAEKYYDLAEENAKLKKHQTELDEDIKKMAARLKRIKSLISKERKLAGGVLGNEFEQELDSIIDENTELKSENKKMKATIKGMKAQLKKGPYGKVLGKPAPAHKTPDSDREHVEIINKLRDRLKENMRIIETYKEENLLLRKGHPEHEPSREIIQKLQESDNEIVRMKCSLQEVTANYEGLNAVFEKCKKRNNELLDELRDKKNQVVNLTAQITALERTSGVVDDLKEKLRELEQEKTGLEKRLDELLTEPFFKREAGTSAHNRIAKLEMERDEKDKIIKNFKEKILNQTQKMGELEAAVEIEKNHVKDLEEKYEEIRIRYEGTGEMTIDSVQKQLMKLDPSAFRKTMEDLNYQGIEPTWATLRFSDEDEKEIDIDDPKSLLREIDRLKNSKKEIAAELERCQQMLKLQSNLEEERLSLIREESEQLKVQCKAYKTKIDDLAIQLDQRQKENAELRKALSRKGYAVKDLKLDKTMESVSDFSDMTEETTLGHQENVLDVAVDRAEFYSNSLVQLLGNHKVKEDSFNTFITISFYDHDTQATDICTGFAPSYVTQFAFRNKFDDFYIEYLDTNTLRIEVYLSKVDKPMLIGRADVLLKDLVFIEPEKHVTKKVVSSTTEIMSASDPNVVIGKIKYKMRLRNAFHQAIKFYHERKAAEVRQDKRETLKAKYKCLSLEIIECKDLFCRGTDPTMVKPFCYYQFYTFDEHCTIVSSGSNPRFDDIQNYKVAFKSELIEYLDKNELEVTILDDAAPLSDAEEKKVKDEDRDVIGMAKIPLKMIPFSRDLSGAVAVVNSKGQPCGALVYKITVTDPISS